MCVCAHRLPVEMNFRSCCVLEAPADGYNSQRGMAAAEAAAAAAIVQIDDTCELNYSQRREY